METTMTDYAHKAAATGSIYLSAISEYDLYHHYVPGLVGEGLFPIFLASIRKALARLPAPTLKHHGPPKIDIIHDVREDVDQQRYFWPREIFGKEAYGFKEIKDIYVPGAL